MLRGSGVRANGSESCPPIVIESYDLARIPSMESTIMQALEVGMVAQRISRVLNLKI
jgi:hypothetical protein